MDFLPFEKLQIKVSLKRENRKSVRFKYVGQTCMISAPFFVSDEQIKEICLKKKKWLLKAYQQVSKIQENNEKNLLLGNEVSVEYVKSSELRYDFKDTHLIIYKSNRLTEESAYLKVKAMMAFDVILPILSEVTKEMNVHIHSINIRPLKSSWGRCTSKKDITLSLKLIECPLDFIRYVCVHECAHTLQMNHSVAFWKIVEHYCPNYKRIRKLNSYTL